MDVGKRRRRAARAAAEGVEDEAGRGEYRVFFGQAGEGGGGEGEEGEEGGLWGCAYAGAYGGGGGVCVWV